MTKRDFKLIASVLADERNTMLGLCRNRREREDVITGLEERANAFADALAETNTNFDRVKFLAACEGIEHNS